MCMLRILQCEFYIILLFCLESKMVEMKNKQDLKMLIWCLSKFLVISATIIGCFGLMGSLVNLNESTKDENKEDYNDILPQHYKSEYMHQSNQSHSSDLQANSSYLYAVVVSPDYEYDEYNILDPSYEYEEPFDRQYDISQLNNDYRYNDYEYEDPEPTLIVKSPRRRPNRYRVQEFSNQRRTYLTRFKDRYGLRFEMNRPNRRRRLYKSRRRGLKIPINRRLIMKRKNLFAPRRKNIEIVSARKAYPIFLGTNNNRKSYLDAVHSPPLYDTTNRRHQNYQNSIITGSKSSGLDLSLLGIFALLQFLGIALNLGLGKNINLSTGLKDHNSTFISSLF